jgi:hypothetical protein
MLNANFRMLLRMNAIVLADFYKPDNILFPGSINDRAQFFYPPNYMNYGYSGCIDSSDE